LTTEERDAEQRWWRLIASDEEALHSQEIKKERKMMREREEGESASERERERERRGGECK